MARLVLIEFTEDTFDADGDLKREKGDRTYVDPVSARSLVEIKKVAARVEDGKLVPAPRKSRVKAEKPEPEDEPDVVSSTPEPDEGEQPA